MLDLERPNTRSAESPAPPAPARPDHRLVAVEPGGVGYGVRLAAALGTAFTILLVAIGAITKLDGVQAFGASAFFLGTVGSAGAAQVRRISLPSFLFFSVAGSMTVTLLVGFVLAETHLWYPTAAFVVLACASLGLHAYGLRGRRWDAAPPARDVADELRAAAIPLTACLTGMALVVSACMMHAGSWAGYSGSLGRLGPLWFIGLALLVLAIPMSTAVPSRWITGFTVIAVATALAATPAILYEYPTVTSAARHVGVAEVIRHLGGVARNGGIYHAWPGLFAGSGMIWDVGNVTNPLGWARWFPVLVNPVSALGVYLLARRILCTRTTSVPEVRLWTGAAIFAVANILGNAYFSPQSTCFVLALAVLLLAVPSERSLEGRGKILRLTGLTVVALADTVTHQLTPYLLVLALAVLLVSRLVRPWWMLALVGVPAVAWALINYSVLKQYINLAAIGDATANAAPPNHGGHLGYRELTKIAIYTPLVLFVAVGIAALVAAFRLRNRLGWALLACAASPSLLFFGNAYGNEALFRVSLFSLPWLVALVVAAPRRHARIRIAPLAAGLLVGVAVFAIGTYGLDWYRVIRPGTVSAVERFEHTAPSGSVLLIPGSGNALPGRLTDRSPGDQYVARDLLKILPSNVNYRPNQDVATMALRLAIAAERLGATKGIYTIVNTATGAYDDLYGIQRYSDFKRMSKAFATSGYWVPVYRAPSATLYRLDLTAFRKYRAGTQ